MSENEVARLIYLLLLLAFIGGALWASGKLALRKHLRDILAWVAIFSVILVAYAQRDTIFAELSPGTPARVNPETLEIRRSLSGSFEAVLRINDETVRFLVDTGATDVVISLRDARRIGLDPATLSFHESARTANGMVRTAPVILDKVEFGGLVDYNVPASVNEGALGASLLGMSYLDRFERIEIRGDAMLLIRR
ncbi:retropepsin-like aspartic protease family protein [Oceanibium sediminis]|uniref:retropepsin-like aspartic protease family protein n=1 Tax=Oceanibium sediminis TaxID=2026339 RepID=UPI000DD3D963|nr:TIGR02281 family clan AA aspartic protease [Oceanibium sediminis]